MTWRLPCALRGGHRWSILTLEPGRAGLICARCDEHSIGWDLPDRIGRGMRGSWMHILLKVVERRERADGTFSVTLADTLMPGTCSVVIAETADQPFKVGDRYELTLQPLARRAQPLPAAPRAGVRTSLDAIGISGGKATVETQS